MRERILKQLKAFALTTVIFLGAGILAVVAIYLGLKVQ